MTSYYCQPFTSLMAGLKLTGKTKSMIDLPTTYSQNLITSPRDVEISCRLDQPLRKSSMPLTGQLHPVTGSNLHAEQGKQDKQDKQNLLPQVTFIISNIMPLVPPLSHFSLCSAAIILIY